MAAPGTDRKDYAASDVLPLYYSKFTKPTNADNLRNNANWHLARYLPTPDPSKACPHVKQLIERYSNLPIQGSDAWLESRKGKVTASNVPTILGNNPYKTPNVYYEEKVGIRSNEISDFVRSIMDFGNRNEERALVKYRTESRGSQIEIYSFGLVQHPEHAWLAGSPDGVTSDGVLLEVKCPPRRKIIKGEVPKHYIGQVQILMEIFNLETTHFIQWKGTDLNDDPPEFDVVVLQRDREWFARSLPILHAFHQRVQSYTPTPKRPLPDTTPTTEDTEVTEGTEGTEDTESVQKKARTDAMGEMSRLETPPCEGVRR